MAYFSLNTLLVLFVNIFKSINSVYSLVAQEISHFSFCHSFLQQFCIIWVSEVAVFSSFSTLSLSLEHRGFVKKTRNISFFPFRLVQLSLLIDVTAWYVGSIIPLWYLRRLRFRLAIIKPGVKVSGRQTSSRKNTVAWWKSLSSRARLTSQWPWASFPLPRDLQFLTRVLTRWLWIEPRTMPDV